MKPTNLGKNFRPVSAAVLVWCIGHALPAIAAGPALQGQVTIRPLTPSEIRNYSLTGAQRGTGLRTIAVGEPAYLEALINNAVPNADVTNVTWTLTAKPGGSAAALS